ncbi:MAG TPA: hypothetical protein VGK78_05565 [Nocardioides sp.]|uniref:hypothetical protein n=1 Tax=Nocardioides sp. TaxID=35761 RepID=UPI002F3E38AE
MADHEAEEIQRFRPTNGRAMGALGLAMAACAAVLFVVYESPAVAVPGVLGCAFLAGLVWMAMLRPSVAATTTELRLRTLAGDVSIPLASIETVVVRRYLLVRSGGQKYICPAISRPLRKTVRAEMRWSGSPQMLSPDLSEERLSGGRLRTEVKGANEMAYPDFVEQRITQLAVNDRLRLGIQERSEEEYELGSQVVRRTAWLEIGVLAALAAAFVVTLVVL